MNLRTNNIEVWGRKKWWHSFLKETDSNLPKISLQCWIYVSTSWSETTSCLNCDRSLNSRRTQLFKTKTGSSSFCSVSARETVLTSVHVLIAFVSKKVKSTCTWTKLQRNWDSKSHTSTCSKSSTSPTTRIWNRPIQLKSQLGLTPSLRNAAQLRLRTSLGMTSSSGTDYSAVPRRQGSNKRQPMTLTRKRLPRWPLKQFRASW